MSDRMTQIIEAAEAQGFKVEQTAKATWLFSKGGFTTAQTTPHNAVQWLRLIADLRAAGLIYPPP